MSARPPIRASDADRERVAERLRRAAGEGRLLTEELEERLERLFSSRTYHELDAIVADLPGRRHPRPRMRGALVPAAALVAVLATVAVAAAVIFIATGVIAGWLLWLVVAWWFFGARRGRRSGRHRGAYRGGHRGGCGSWDHRRGPARGSWT